jgi:hypothetical protein
VSLLQVAVYEMVNMNIILQLQLDFRLRSLVTSRPNSATSIPPSQTSWTCGDTLSTITSSHLSSTISKQASAHSASRN